MFAFKRLNIPRTYNFSFGHNYVNYMQKVNLSQFSRKKFDLFNRKQEFDLLTTKFSSNTPEIHVILGPSDSGKTTLVRQVVQNGNFNPLFIDLRNSSGILLLRDIRSEFQNFFESIFIKPKTKLETVNKLDYKLLKKISSSLPNLSYWKNHNIPPPILVIDEANKLFEEYKTLFKAFLSWLKLIIQNNQFHVVLTSSEPFFLDWMEYSLHTMRLTPHVVGDLSIEEAKQFVNHELENNVFVVMVRIKFFSAMKYGFNNQDIKTSDMLFTGLDYIYNPEYIRMRWGLDPKYCESRAKYNNFPIYWEKSHFITAMKALVEAEDQGFILEDDLIKEIGYKAVRSLVDYRYLYRRPNFGLNSDLTNPPAESKVMLTPMNQPSLNAAKDLLKENNY
ncbi:12928_t:CDS:2 [Rhizophagus irregularis]|nr:12928_t:CDS:2 [Rhizophagus irregularis]